jgi:Bacterial Ig-like domain
VTASDHRRPRAELVRYVVNPADPINVTFNEPVNGITAATGTLRRLIGPLRDPTYGPIILGAWTCADDTGATASCRSGTVQSAEFTPTRPLKPSENYSLALNPEHSLGLTDLAGNPLKRHEEWLSTSP